MLDTYHLDFQSLVDKNYEPLFEKLKINDHNFLAQLLEVSKIQNNELKEIALEEYQDRFGVNTYFYSLRGKLEYDSGRYDKARHSYMKSLDLDPKNTDALNNLGYLYHYTYAEPLAAQKLYEQVLAVNPNLITTLLNLGLLYRSLKMTALSISIFKHALHLDSSCYQAHQNLANIFSIEEQDIEKAEIHYKLALKYNSTHVETLLSYGNFLKVFKNDIEAGNKLYRKAKKYDQNGNYKMLLNTVLKHTKM